MYSNVGNKWFTMQAQLVWELFGNGQTCHDFLELPIKQAVETVSANRFEQPDSVPYSSAEITAMMLYHCRLSLENQPDGN